MIPFPTVDPVQTGANIVRLRKAAGLTVHDLQMAFGFNSPQAIYKWQNGTALPTVDNLIGLAALLRVHITISSSSIPPRRSAGSSLPAHGPLV